MAAACEAVLHLTGIGVRQARNRISRFQDNFYTFRHIIWNVNVKIRPNVDAEEALCNLPSAINEQETKTNTFSQSNMFNHSGLESVDYVLLLMAFFELLVPLS